MKILKWIGIIIGVFLLILLFIGMMLNEPKPKGEASAQADDLATQMLIALNEPAWDSTDIVAWTFRYSTHYLWDKKRDFVEVSWEDMRVLLNTKTITGLVYQQDKIITGKEAEKNIQKAWASFCNDSYWLIAPYKVFDPSTSRSLIETKDGRQGLMVQYGSGGITPGDTYVWFLGPDYIPVSYKMWVSILPIGGIETTWEDWKTIDGGAKIAYKRFLFGKREIPISNIKAGQGFLEFDRQIDPFSGL